MRIALIGSRQLEQKEEYFKDIKLCHNVCMRLAQLGVTFTSGLCELGMDGIAQKAYSKLSILDMLMNHSLKFTLQINITFVDQHYLVNT